MRPSCHENSPSKPPSLRAWAWLNLKIGALSFGASSRLALYQDACVDEFRWLSNDEFQESLTIAQLLPGPSLVNLAMYLGLVFLDFWAALLGLFMLVLPGALLIILMLSVVNLNNPHVSLLFQGFSLGSVILFLVFLSRVSRGLFHSGRKALPLGRLKIFFRSAIVLSAALASIAQLPLIPVILIGIVVSMLVEFML